MGHTVGYGRQIDQLAARLLMRDIINRFNYEAKLANAIRNSNRGPNYPRCKHSSWFKSWLLIGQAVLGSIKFHIKGSEGRVISDGGGGGRWGEKTKTK